MGGITAVVAERESNGVRRLVQLDAYVPADGDSGWSFTSDRFRRAIARGALRTGFAVDPPSGSPERARPHPLAAFMQGAPVTGALQRVARRESVLCAGWEGTPFAASPGPAAGDPRLAGDRPALRTRSAAAGGCDGDAAGQATAGGGQWSDGWPARFGCCLGCSSLPNSTRGASLHVTTPLLMQVSHRLRMPRPAPKSGWPCGGLPCWPVATFLSVAN